MKFHWGTPKARISIKAKSKIVIKQGDRTFSQVLEHDVEKLYGISFGADLFIGVHVLGATRRYSEDV